MKERESPRINYTFKKFYLGLRKKKKSISLKNYIPKVTRYILRIENLIEISKMYEDRLNVYSKTNEIIPLSSWQACTKWCEKFAISTEIFFIPSFFITKKYEREIYGPLNANVKTSKRLGMEKWWWLWTVKISSKNWTIYNFSFCLTTMEIS